MHKTKYLPVNPAINYVFLQHKSLIQATMFFIWYCQGSMVLHSLVLKNLRGNSTSGSLPCTIILLIIYQRVTEVILNILRKPLCGSQMCDYI